jgi:O-methyltransferase
MSQVKQAVKKMFRVAGFDLTRVANSPVTAPTAPALKNYYFESDETFKSFYREGIKASGSRHNPEVVHQRMYNAVEFLRYSLDLEGEVVECGAFLGLSSYVFCNYIRLADPDFEGAGYHIFDSFEGLSQPSEQDAITDESFGAVGTHAQPAGSFHGSLDTVKTTLRDFPGVEYHQGWIPESFAGQPERKYKFVHVDLDLYDPIKGAVEYFYPRLVKGGVIVIDEYGFPRWPGARRALDEFCQAHGLTTPVCLTTGNGVLIKK